MKKIDCEAHGESEAIMTDLILLRLSCVSCLTEQQDERSYCRGGSKTNNCGCQICQDAYN